MKTIHRVFTAFLMILTTATITGCSGRISGLPKDMLIPVVKTETGKAGFINTEGKIVIEPIYKCIEAYDEAGFAEVTVREESGWFRCGLIEKSGKVVFPIEFQDIRHDVLNGIVIAGRKQQNGTFLYAYYDMAGLKIFPNDFEEASEFVDGCAFVKEKGLWRIIDRSCNTIKKLPGITHIATGTIESGFCAFTTEPTSKLWLYTTHGYLDLKGNVVVAEQDIIATGGIDDGFALIIDRTDFKPKIMQLPSGTITAVIDGYFEYGFTDGCAIGRGDKGVGVIDTEGKWIISPKHERITYDDGVLSVKLKTGKYEYYDRNGKLLFTNNLACSPYVYGCVFCKDQRGVYAIVRNGNTVLRVPTGFVPLMRHGYANVFD